MTNGLQPHDHGMKFDTIRTAGRPRASSRSRGTPDRTPDRTTPPCSPPEAGPPVSSTSRYSSLDSPPFLLVVVRRSCTARTGLLRPCGYSHCTPTCTRPAPCTTAWPGFSRVGSAHDGPRPHTGWAIPTLHFRRICCAHSACASLTKKVACGCSPASSSEMPVLASVPTKRG